MTGLEADAGQGTQVLRTDNPAAGQPSAASAAHQRRQASGVRMLCRGQMAAAGRCVRVCALVTSDGIGDRWLAVGRNAATENGLGTRPLADAQQGWRQLLAAAAHGSRHRPGAVACTG